MSPRPGDRPQAPDPPRKDDAGNPMPATPARPGEPPEASSWGGEGGAGEYRGGPDTSRPGGGSSEVM
jgi:hypothetical protein